MLGWIIAATAAAANATPPNPCTPASSCRFVQEVSLRDDGGVVHTNSLAQWVPFISGGKLRLLPGEMVTLKTEGSPSAPVVTAYERLPHAPVDTQLDDLIQKRAGDDALGSAEKQHEAVEAKADEIRVYFGQLDNSPQSLLSVSNGYDRALSYKAAIPDRSGRLTPTTVCPVLAHGGAIEGWPNPEVTIELSGFVFTPRGQRPVILAECNNSAT